jgi:HemK-like putative methylase
MQKKKFNTAIDICSGSGCIGISLALENPLAAIDAIEISEIAVQNMNANITQFNCRKNVNVIHSDILTFSPQKSYDLIVSNPPYIHKRDLVSLDPSVRHYDPEDALTDGEAGLKFYHRIFNLSGTILNDNGRIILEFGSKEQSQQIINIFKGFKHTIYNDLSNFPRIIEFRA